MMEMPSATDVGTSCESSGVEGSSQDLPLLSNTGDIQVYHYILDLTCDLTSHVMRGSITLFLEPHSSSGCNRRVFSMQDHHRVGSKLSQQHTNAHNVDAAGEMVTASGSGCSLHDDITGEASTSFTCDVIKKTDTVPLIPDSSAKQLQTDNPCGQSVLCSPARSDSKESGLPRKSNLTPHSTSLQGSHRLNVSPSHPRQPDSPTEHPCNQPDSCTSSSRIITHLSPEHLPCASQSHADQLSITTKTSEKECWKSNTDHIRNTLTGMENLCPKSCPVPPLEMSTDYVSVLPLETESESENPDVVNPDVSPQGTVLKETSEISSSRPISPSNSAKHSAIISETGSCDISTSHVNPSVNFSNNSDDFEFILDCVDLEISQVEEVVLPHGFLHKLQQCHHHGLRDTRELFSKSRQQPSLPLQFTVDKWCVRMWKTGAKKPEDFPCVVKISYKTKPSGSSLRWALDQEGRPCMYTAAMFINNRAFFPGQEFGSLSTWQAYIRVPKGAVVIMSGDREGEIVADAEGTDGEGNVSQDATEEECGLTWYHECRMALPVFTLAIAVGFWEHVQIHTLTSSDHTLSDVKSDITCHHQCPPCRINYTPTGPLPCRLFAPRSLLPKIEAELRDYWPRCSQAVQTLLGSHPFWHVDIVIYPSCSQDMAMANPNLMFLSQSVFAGDGSMMVKVAHELTHSWFGLLIGAKDWTEEWLSEGFATYLEDSVHALAMGWSEDEARERAELRALIRQHTLQAEMGTTQDSLQVLRPNHDNLQDEDQVTSVKNGMNAYKMFTQVHYLKGYFLLRHLSSVVGVEKFNNMLKNFIIKFHGAFVLSQDFLNLCFTTFPELSAHGLSMESVYSDWLDCSGMPKGMDTSKISVENQLYHEVLTEASKWKSFNRTAQKKSLKRKRKQYDASDWIKLNADQLVLVLEDLLDIDVMASSTMTNLRRVYSLEKCNADVRHRWCELIIMHRHSRYYDDIHRFLIHDQAMGVYLYGELMISQCRKQQQLARDSFHIVGSQMEPTTHSIVKKMLYAE